MPHSLSRRVVLAGASCLALVTTACGDPTPPSLDSAVDCATRWQPIAATAPGDFDLTSPLAYHDGTLFFSSLVTRSLSSVSATGGVTTLAPINPHELWVEDDHLVFEGGDAGLQLFTLPFAGGTPALLFDGAVGRAQPGIGQFHAFTSTDFFWAETDRAGGTYGRSTVWRASRPNGAPALVGSATARTPDGRAEGFSTMALADDAVLLAAGIGTAVAIPFDGSGVRSLATESLLGTTGLSFTIGIDRTGVYRSTRRPGTTFEDDSSIIVLVPADAGPARIFWEGPPKNSAPFGIWPIDDGGWVVATYQLFDDQHLHTAIWLVDGSGQGRRLACSPASNGSGAPQIRVRPVATPDAVYVVANGATSEIVRVPR